MAENPFDQFDTPAQGTAATANPFDQFDAAKTAPAPSEQQHAHWYDNALRGAGLQTRAVINGLTGPVQAAGDVFNAGVNAATGGINSVAGTNIPALPKFSQVTQGQMNAAGLPRPVGPYESVASAGTEGLVGGYGFASMAERLASTVANPLAKGVLSMLGQSKTMQAAQGGLGAMSGQMAANARIGPAGQMIASTVGGLAPSMPDLLGSGARALMRGGDQNLTTMAERTAALKAAGITNPSVGQVTGQHLPQAVESVLSKSPGGAGVMAKTGERQMSEIGRKAEEVADSLSTHSTPMQAGDAIEKGISGEGGFISRFKAGQKALYDKLDSFLPKTAQVDIGKTKSVLSSMNSDIEGAPALSQFFKNAKIEGMESALKSDTEGVAAALSKPQVKAQADALRQAETQKAQAISAENVRRQQLMGTSAVITPVPTSAQIEQKVTDFLKTQVSGSTLPYESIKKLRTLVGAQLENPSLASDVPRSKWKALYASLSEDLDNAAIATGNPEAIKAMHRANQFSKAGYGRIESVLEGVAKGNTSEQIFQAATSSGDMKAGATKIATVLKSLGPAERDVVKSAVIRRMGKATAGNQNAAGDVFSSNTFLTNWNNISPEAKAVLFSGKDGEIAKSLTSIAKTAQYIKEGSKVFANPSGTQPALAAYGALTVAASAVASGNLIGAGLVGAGVAGANFTAKMMTNPAVLKWLEKSVNLPPAAVPAALQNLARVSKDEDEGVQSEVSQYINSFDNAPDKIRSVGDQISGAK